MKFIEVKVIMLSASKAQLFSEAREAIVEEPVRPKVRGTIKCQGIFYHAELYSNKSHSLRVGQRAYMVGIRDNIALIVA